ncbi:hypothetical protein E4U54_008310 [Claviceps lovelessii]|nr:hypothetical protein E4U54_008310 [Claviceps lovelessii]
MAPAGLLITAGALAIMATAATMTLEIVLCVDAADNSSLADTCGAAAALEAVALVMLGALAFTQAVQHKIPSFWSRSKLCFVLQLLICGAAAATSIVALVFSPQAMSDQSHDPLGDVRQNVRIGLAIALTLAAMFQFVFISFHFLVHSDLVIGSSCSPFCFSDDQRNKHVKGIRYSQTMPMMTNQETTSVKGKSSTMTTHQKSSKSPIDSLKASLKQVIHPASSRTKLLGLERKRPMSLESAPPRTSADTSFDSWDTSTVDVHNRQAVMELSPPPALNRALETIPASPSGSVASSRPATPLDPGCLDSLEPPQVLRRIESYSSSLRARREANRLTSDSSINEMHIHPLFRSDSPIPPPPASPGTSVLAAPNAGLIISRSGSVQSLQRLRSGSLPALRSPLTPQQAGLDSLEQTRAKDDKEVPPKDAKNRSDRRMTPPIPEWLLSPTMKANLESFKEQQQEQGGC